MNKDQIKIGEKYRVIKKEEFVKKGIIIIPCRAGNFWVDFIQDNGKEMCVRIDNLEPLEETWEVGDKLESNRDRTSFERCGDPTIKYIHEGEMCVLFEKGENPLTVHNIEVWKKFGWKKLQPPTTLSLQEAETKLSEVMGREVKIT